MKSFVPGFIQRLPISQNLLRTIRLYQAGFEVGRYVSLEMIVENTKDSYYEALAKSSRRDHRLRCR